MSKLVRSSLLLAMLLAALVLPGAANAATAYTPQTYAARLLDLFNATRQQHGLQPVTVASGTQTVAGAWTERLASDQALSHNPNLRSQLESHGSSQWTVYGENVGDADTQDPDGLFDAYMASPEHRDNVLTKEFRYIGNAVVFAGGRAWNTMDLVDAYSTGTATRTAPKPVVRHKAPVTTTPAVTTKTAPVRTAPKSSPAAAPRPLPRSDRGSARTPIATRPLSRVEVTRPDAPLLRLSIPANTPPFDTRRVLVLAIAAMLALHMAGLWVGVAARRTR
ncbi:MAG: hypothetical protein QOE64_2287 [Frankiales bacterium]|jgi:uncharacterized protein YkwD|nr:hypothetical protein [Frankiales bacterium]